VPTTMLVRPATPPFCESDDVLVAAMRGRDERAYSFLVRRHSPLMLRVASRYLVDDLAEDVVQDTWMAVLRHIDRFEQRSSFKTWLMHILVNTLSICRGLANTSKHRTRDSSNSIYAPVQGVGHLNADDSARATIEWKRNGQVTHEDALDLAERCMAAWRQFLNDNWLSFVDYFLRPEEESD
jgi:RNA polymerase sigma factor (sigma-70 family)